MTNSIDRKIHAIDHFMENCTFPEGFSELNFTSEEMEFLSDHCSVRFKESKTGYICYFSRLPGKQGLGSSALTAFCFMLKNTGFKILKEGLLSEQLETHFRQTL